MYDKPPNGSVTTKRYASASSSQRRSVACEMPRSLATAHERLAAKEAT